MGLASQVVDKVVGTQALAVRGFENSFQKQPLETLEPLENLLVGIGLAHLALLVYLLSAC